VLYVGQFEEKEGFTYKVRFMWRQGHTWKFSVTDEDDMNEIERKDFVAKLPQLSPSGGMACTTRLKYFWH
jgi:hypothetical protein